MQTNQISIDGNGNITLQNVQGSTITIQPGENTGSVLAKLAQLQEEQKRDLQHILEQQGNRFNDLKRLLQHVEAQPTPHALTARIPSTDPNSIVGREKDLQSLRNMLSDNQQVVVVNGLGGIGKTTLAQAYVGRHAGDYAHVLWMTQSEGDNFVFDLVTTEGLAESLRLETTGKDVETLFRELLTALKSLPGTQQPCLWVIDNAHAGLHRYYDYLPKPPRWHILATSRERIEHFTTKDLDFLPEDEALRLFQTHCTRISDEAAIRSLIKTVDYHTLTIEILAKTAQRHDTPAETLQQAIEKDLVAGVYIQHKGEKIERITSYLLSIFEINALSAEEHRLLQHLVALPGEYIPYELLKTLVPAEESIAPTLQDLADKGWLLAQTQPEAYKMHRIIQTVVLKKIPPAVEDVQGLIENVRSLLEIDETKDNPVDKFPFIPYGEAVLVLFPEATQQAISRLQNNLAVVLLNLGDYEGAKALLEKAVVSAEQNFGKEHPTTVLYYSNLATVLQALGEYELAKGLLEKAVLSDERNFGTEHPTTAVRYSNLATVLQDLGDYEGAILLSFKAYQVYAGYLGVEHPNTKIIRGNVEVIRNEMLENGWTEEGIKALLEGNG